MKATINGNLYNTDGCEILGSYAHSRNGECKGEVSLVRASNEVLLVWTNTNGKKDQFLEESLYIADNMDMLITAIDLTDKQQARLVELGIIEIIPPVEIKEILDVPQEMGIEDVFDDETIANAIGIIENDLTHVYECKQYIPYHNHLGHSLVLEHLQDHMATVAKMTSVQRKRFCETVEDTVLAQAKTHKVEQVIPTEGERKTYEKDPK